MSCAVFQSTVAIMYSATAQEDCKIRFRYLKPEDAEALRDVRHRAILECAPQFGTPPQIELARSADHYRRQLERGRQWGGQAILGGWIQGHLSAMVGIRRRKTAEGPVGLITSMFVDPNWRRRGVGAALLRQACQRMVREWGVTRTQMNVEIHNHPAIELYARHGFRIIGQQDHAFIIEGVSHSVFLLERNEEGFGPDPL